MNKPIEVASGQLEAIIDALFNSPKREVTLQVSGKAPLTLTVKRMAIGEHPTTLTQKGNDDEHCI